jgi:hypothetical protein
VVLGAYLTILGRHSEPLGLDAPTLVLRSDEAVDGEDADASQAVTGGLYLAVLRMLTRCSQTALDGAG